MKTLRKDSILWHILHTISLGNAASFPALIAEICQSTPIKESSLRATLTKAKKDNYLTVVARRPRLTEKGYRALKPYEPKRIQGQRELMVIFDIPEQKRPERRKLRTFLQDLGFRQSQRSVWLSEYNHRDMIIAFVAEQRLGDYVALYEVTRLR